MSLLSASLRWGTLFGVLYGVLLPFCGLAEETPPCIVPGGEESRLTMGQPRVLEARTGSSQCFLVALEPGELLRVEVSQQEVDVELSFSNPHGRTLEKRDGDWLPEVPEVLSVVAEEGGLHRLTVAVGQADPDPGHYELRALAKRRAESDDWLRPLAEELSYQTAYRWLTGAPKPRVLAAAMPAALLWRQLGEPHAEAEVLYWAAAAHEGLGETVPALELYGRALDLWRPTGPAERRAETLRHLGALLAGQGQRSEARERYEEALGACSEVSRSRRKHECEAAVRQSLGRLLYDEGSLLDARGHFARALELRRALGEADLVRDSLTSLGSVYGTLGEPQRDLALQWEAYELGRREGVLTAAVLNNLATAYSRVGDYETARRFYEQALEENRERGDWVHEITTLNNLAWVHEALEDESEALRLYDQALEASRAQEDRRLEAIVLTSLGRVRMDLGEHAEALARLEVALPLRRARGDRRGLAVTLQDLGKLEVKLGRFSAAQEHLDEALALARASGDRPSEARILSRLGLLAGARGDFETALQRSGEALAMVESERGAIERRDFKGTYTAAKLPFYEVHLGLLMNAHRAQPGAGWAERAFETSDRLRARNLLDWVQEGGIDLRRGVEPALLEREAAARRRLVSVGARLDQAREAGLPEPEITALDLAVEEAVGELEEVRQQIRHMSPAYATLTQPEPLRLAELQSRGLAESEVLLEYFLGEERSFVWAVTSTSVTVAQLPRRREIESRVEAWRRALVPHGNEEEARLGGALSHILLEPVARALKGDRLVVVPDGALHYLPFAALPLPREALSRGDRRLQNPPLVVDRFAVVTEPSASFPAVLRRRLADRPPAPRTVAVFADAVFSPADPRLTAVSSPGGDLGVSPPPEVEAAARDLPRGGDRASRERLPATAREAEALRALVPEKQQRYEALDFAATRETLLALPLADFRILHLAAHGEIDSERPELSRLALTQLDASGVSLGDGDLHLADVYNLELAADLVVLSACETALGRQVRGEGLVGLTRGFFHAGAARVLASLWRVTDTATAELVTRFYRHLLRDGLPAPEALAAAQRSMRGERVWEATEFWAGFVLQGEWHGSLAAGSVSPEEAP